MRMKEHQGAEIKKVGRQPFKPKHRKKPNLTSFFPAYSPPPEPKKEEPLEELVTETPEFDFEAAEKELKRLEEKKEIELEVLDQISKLDLTTS